MVGTRAASAAFVMVLVFTVGAAVPAGAGDEPEPEITVTELLGPDGEQLARGVEINERGQVLASRRVDYPDGSWPDRNDVLWHRGTATPLGPEDASVVGWHLSEQGHVVGILQEDRPDCPSDSGIPFRWRNGVLTELECGIYHGPEPWTINRHGDILGLNAAQHVVVWHGDGGMSVAPRPTAPTAYPVDINDRGRALIEDNGAGKAAVWRLGRGIRLLDGPDGSASYGSAINRAGDVAGAITVEGESHAALWRDGELVDLGTIGGRVTAVIDVNDRGQVIGQGLTAAGEEHAFLWDGERMVDLGTLGGPTSRPSAVNEKGQVVGWSEVASRAWHPFLWDDGRIVDLTPGADDRYNSFAHDINDKGQIVGLADDADGGGAVMWTVAD